MSIILGGRKSSKQFTMNELKTSIIERGGFGLFKRRRDEKEDSTDIKARALAENIVKEIDKSVETQTDKLDFYAALRYYLGGIIAGTYEAEGDNYERSKYRVPRSFYKDKEEYDQQYCGIDSHFFDHFSKRGDKFVSHLYDIGHGELIEAVKWAQERGFRLRLTAESNYFPGRTIQVEFERIEK